MSFQGNSNSLNITYATSSKSFFSMIKNQKMISHGLSKPSNVASSTSPVIFWDVQKAVYEFQGPFAYLKHHSSDFFQVDFFDAQDS
jgi:hypothetical protein